MAGDAILVCSRSTLAARAPRFCFSPLLRPRLPRLGAQRHLSAHFTSYSTPIYSPTATSDGSEISGRARVDATSITLHAHSQRASWRIIHQLQLYQKIYCSTAARWSHQETKSSQILSPPPPSPRRKRPSPPLQPRSINLQPQQLPSHPLSSPFVTPNPQLGRMADAHPSQTRRAVMASCRRPSPSPPIRAPSSQRRSR